MGLDMYFKARKRDYEAFSRIDAENGRPEEASYPEDLKVLEDYIMDTNFKSVEIATDYKIGYFRKFNALHSYIVNNYADGVDNCQSIYLRKADIEKILDICKQISEDHSKAEELMPTCSGFFFGSTYYDDWYFNDIEEAIKLFNLILDNNVCSDYDIIYLASW